MNRRIGSTLIAVALGVSASSVFACNEHAQAADVKDQKVVAAKADAKDGEMPCCAHAKAAGDKAKGCPKKAAVTAAAVAKAEPAKEAAPAAPPADPGTHR